MGKALGSGARAKRPCGLCIDAYHLAGLVAAQTQDLLIGQLCFAHFRHAALTEARKAHSIGEMSMLAYATRQMP